jgi:hypothetical protein
MLRWITCIILFFFQFRIQILTHVRVKLSCYWVLIRANTHDDMERVSHSRADFDVAATDASSWILATTASRSIHAAIVSSRSSRPEFQHSSPTFRLGILVTAVGTSSWRARPVVGNASMNDTNVAAAVTFFTTGRKIFVPPFNCYICNTRQCRTTR